jgi:HK97 family phage prohead protease
MPYPNEHACRLRDPDDFQDDSFRRVKRKHEGKEYSVIMGRLKDEDTMTEQAYRYQKDTWTADEARAHCQDHDGSFEAAQEEKSQPRVIINEMGIERRFVAAEVRVVEDSEGQPHIQGYGAVFNEWSLDLGGFRESIEPGAFTKTLQEADIRSLWNHNPDYILGRNRSGSLRLYQDERGLGYDVIPPDAQWARDLMVSIKRGDVSQASFGFETLRDKWDQDEDGKVTRRLLEVKLFDVGPVTFAAYPQTSAEARSKAQEIKQSTAAPGQGPHPADADEDRARARLEIARRRLDLAEYHNINVGGQHESENSRT